MARIFGGHQRLCLLNCDKSKVTANPKVMEKGTEFLKLKGVRTPQGYGCLTLQLCTLQQLNKFDVLSRRVFIVLPSVSLGDYLTNKPTQRVQHEIHPRECFFME